MIAQVLCTVCNKQTEVLSEKNLTPSVISRKLQCGHPQIAKNYSLQIEKIREEAKKAKFRSIENLLGRSKKIIREMEKTGEPNVDSSKELLEELQKSRDAKLDDRKKVAKWRRTVEDDRDTFSDGERSVIDFIFDQFDKDGELDDEDFAKLKRLADNCIENRKSRSYIISSTSIATAPKRYHPLDPRRLPR